MPWQSRLLRGARVWVLVDDAGKPQGGTDGRVDVLYKPGGKVYRAGVRNLEVDPAVETLKDAAPAGKPAPSAASGPSAASAPRRAARDVGTVKHVDGDFSSSLIAYTDGACSGNPGPMGIGVVILDGDERIELSEYLGVGTNNIAELVAIERALETCDPDRPVIVHSDSAYALGLLGLGWKAKANQELVARIRQLVTKFSRLRLVKVEGHAGVPENERCDELARAAVVRRA